MTLIGLLAGLSAAASPAAAQAEAPGFPSKPITLVVYSAAGGPVDLLARLLADGLKTKLPKPIVVENRTGAAGVAASLYVKSQPPDGHTLLYGAMTTAIFAPQIRPQQPYDTRTDFTAVARTIGYTLLVVANPDVPFGTPTELAAYAKAHPGALNYGTNGFGAWTHIAMELFLDRAGIKVVHVPYTGNAPALQAVLAGDIQLALVDINIALEHIRSGKLKVVGQLGAQRAAQFPDVPTLGETAPELATDFWLGIFGPPGMPQPVVQTLNRHINAFSESPAMQKKAEDIFMRVQTSSPGEFTQLVAHDWTLWGQVIREHNLIMK